MDKKTANYLEQFLAGKPMNSNRTWNANGKTVLITGAGSGFGAACAHEAYAAGANVVLIDESYSALVMTACDFSSARTLTIAANVADLVELENTMDEIVEKFGRLDVVFANLGFTSEIAQSFMTLPQSESGSSDVNLQGIWNTVRASMPLVIRNNGHIQITASKYKLDTGLVNVSDTIPPLAAELFEIALKNGMNGTDATAGVFYPGKISDEMKQEKFENHVLAIDLMKSVYHGMINFRADSMSAAWNEMNVTKLVAANLPVMIMNANLPPPAPAAVWSRLCRLQGTLTSLYSH